jgi:hypothetical protein
MPSILHESLLELFRNRPMLAPELLRDALGVKLPALTEKRGAILNDGTRDVDILHVVPGVCDRLQKCWNIPGTPPVREIQSIELCCWQEFAEHVVDNPCAAPRTQGRISTDLQPEAVACRKLNSAKV